MRRLRYRTYQSTTQAAPSWPGYEVERPTGRPTFESMVLVPLCQALIIGLAGGPLTTWGLVEVLDVGGWWPAVGILTLAWFGLAFVTRASAAEATLWSVERFIGADLDGDGTVGDPEPQAHLVTVGPARLQTTPEERLRREFVLFVQGCEASGDTSMRRWESRLGRERYQEWRDALIKAGLASWVRPGEPRQGWRLSQPAEEIVAAVF